MSTALESNSLTLEWLYGEVSSTYWTHSIDGGVTSCRSDTYKLVKNHRFQDGPRGWTRGNKVTKVTEVTK